MTSFEKLRDAMTGTVVLPGDPEWDRARGSWNLSIDQHPVAVVEAAGVADVQAAVRFAVEAGLRVAPQSTGHGSESLGPLEGALLLKTSSMRQMAIDEQAKLARVEAGALAGAIADAAGAHGLAPVLGLAATVGAVGLALSGGAGWLSRRHGLAANNVQALDVVLADGEARHVDANTEPDLFWALRGGGGRSAIVTSLEMRAHAVPELHGGAVMWPAERAAEILERFGELTADAPEELSVVFRYLSIPDVDGPPPPLRGKQLVSLVAANLGPEPPQFSAIRGIPGAVVDMLGPIQPAQLVHIAGDPEQPIPARGAGFLLDDFPAEAARELANAITSGSLPALTVLEVRHLVGAMSRAPEGHGAAGSLAGSHSMFAGGAAVSPEASAAIDANLDTISAALGRWRSPRELLSSAPATVDPSSGFDAETWERLRAIERRYDPQRVILSNRDL
jgi:hypothetical protein